MSMINRKQMQIYTLTTHIDNQRNAVDQKYTRSQNSHNKCVTFFLITHTLTMCSRQKFSTLVCVLVQICDIHTTSLGDGPQFTSILGAAIFVRYTCLIITRYI
jgi:hypothetical protein